MRFLTPNSKPFDPLELARLTETIVCREGRDGLERKYVDFYATGVYRGVATGYTAGCCLRCIFCWGGLERDFPEKFGRFCSPYSAFRRIEEAAKKYGVRKARISGGAEPTIGKRHLLSLLEEVEGSDVIDLFILETNGFLFGAEKGYVRALGRFEKVYVRVSLKAGSPEGLERRCGALRQGFELPYKAIEYLLDEGMRFHVAAMTDRRLMPVEEREALIERLSELDPKLVASLEEEVVDPYDATLLRLRAAGADVKGLFLEAKPIY